MKKILSFFLALLMLAGSVLPVLAADDAGGEALENAEKVYTIDDMYVQGATFKWDAFDMKATDEPITKFENQVDTTNVSLPSAVTVTMGDKYVLYPYTTSNFQFSSKFFSTYSPSGSSRKLPDDYTFEMTVHQHWDDTCATNSNVKWAIAGFGTGSSWGGQFQFVTQEPSETRGMINKMTSMYAVMNADTGKLTDTYKNAKAWTSIFTNLLEKPYSVGWVHDATFSTDATYHPSTDVPMRDGALSPSLVRNHYLRTAAYDDLNDKGFKIGSYVPFAYYAIRIYPFALNAEQTAQNHFAELCDYHGISDEAVNAYFALSEDAKNSLHNAFIGVTYPDTSAEELQAIIFDMAEKALYTSLYVQDGAVFLWNSFLPGAVANGYFVNFLDNGVTLGDGTAAIEKESSYGYTAYAGKLDFTSLIQKEDGTYGEALNLEIGLRLTSDYGNITRFFGPLAHLSNNDYDAGLNDKFTYSTEKRTDGNDSFGMIKGPYRAYPLANLTSVTYYFKDEADTAPITEEAYNALSDGEKEAYTLNVAVPCYDGTYSQIGFDQNGYWNGHVMGNYTNETYSFGVAMTFDLANNSFDFSFLRDTEKAQGVAVAKKGLLYVPGKAMYGGVTFVAPTSYEAAVNNTALENSSFNAWTTNDQGFYFGQASAEYYSLHLYNTELSDMQRKQNHFADLVSYFRPGNIDAFIALSDEQKQKVYTILSEREELFVDGVTNTSFEDIDALGGRAYIENVIASVNAQVNAEEFLIFDGYQVRTQGEVGLRSRYTLKADAVFEGVTLVEIGAIAAIADGRTTADLTVVKGEDGNYQVAGERMKSQAVYQKGEIVGSTFEKDGTTHFAYTVLFDSDSETKEYFTTELLFRGYVVVEIDGAEYVLYTDMNGESFGGQALSVYDLSCQESNIDYVTSQRVLAVVEDN